MSNGNVWCGRLVDSPPSFPFFPPSRHARSAERVHTSPLRASLSPATLLMVTPIIHIFLFSSLPFPHVRQVSGLTTPVKGWYETIFAGSRDWLRHSEKIREASPLIHHGSRTIRVQCANARALSVPAEEPAARVVFSSAAVRGRRGRGKEAAAKKLHLLDSR